MKKMLGCILTLSGLLVLLHGQSANSVRTQLVGTWRFVSSTQRLTDGTVRPDPQTGKKGEGYLIYTENGRVSVVVCNPERPRWTSVQAPTQAEVRNAFVLGGRKVVQQTLGVKRTTGPGDGNKDSHGLKVQH